MEIKREIKQEDVMTILENGQLVAIGYKDMESRHNVYYKVEEMSVEEMGEKIVNETNTTTT